MTLNKQVNRGYISVQCVKRTRYANKGIDVLKRQSLSFFFTTNKCYDAYLKPKQPTHIKRSVNGLMTLVLCDKGLLFLIQLFYR